MLFFIRAAMVMVSLHSNRTVTKAWGYLKADTLTSQSILTSDWDFGSSLPVGLSMGHLGLLTAWCLGSQNEFLRKIGAKWKLDPFL